MEDTNKTVKKTIVKSPKRVFKSQQTLHHDLYVLTPSKMIKDTSLGKTGDPDFLVPVVHQHFFHTIDSAGRTQTYCSSIGGHFHKIEVKPQKDGPPLVETISGPLMFAKKKIHGKLKRVVVPVNHYDEHMHDTTYLQSEEIKPRKANVEAAKVQASQAAVQSGASKGQNMDGQILEG